MSVRVPSLRSNAVTSDRRSFCLAYAAPILTLLLSFWLAEGSLAALPDTPFLQDAAVRIEAGDLRSATFRKLCVDKEGVPYVLTDRGVARIYDGKLALDVSFRPLARRVAGDIALSPAGDLYYLFGDRWLSNGESGEPLGHVPSGKFSAFAVGENGSVLLSGLNAAAVVTQRGMVTIDRPIGQPFSLGGDLFGITHGQLLRIEPSGRAVPLPHTDVSTIARRGDELLIGTHNGFYGIDLQTGRETRHMQRRLPVTDITRMVPVPGGLWFGTTGGVFFLRDPEQLEPAGPQLPDGPNGIRYYASRRWLEHDHVLDLAFDREGHLWVLTRAGLSKIEFRPMTLAVKAEYFDRKIRTRHIRFGLAGERRLPIAGDLATSEIIDTDNDGGWSSYYLASQAFRYAATKSPAARKHAWEVFAALERLQTMPQLARAIARSNNAAAALSPDPGFPARTFERAGFKFSDPDRWREVPGGDWEWKGHTSSDEIASHTFAHAVLWECVAENEQERQRIATNYTRIVDHILEHNLYLIDVDGKPTLWGRWHPEYVNWYPATIFDRRLNSSEIIASLQLAYAMSGQSKYRQKAEALFAEHGYLTNILSSMKQLRDTRGFVHLGNEMGDEWNHSDDELAFVTYWVLHRFAFTDELRRQYGEAIRDHWEFERPEQFPMWNFIYAGCGGAQDCDVTGALWTLRGYPLDTITWRMENRHRKDLTPLEPNFMRRELKELLPPGERLIARCNTQPFILNGGDGGHIEFPGDEYLLGYWLGRYLKLIE
jgi:hypothetical protein